MIASGIVATLSLQWHTASLIEVLWTMAGLIGAYMTWGNLQDTRRYINAIRKRNGTKIGKEVRIIAYGHYRNEIIRIISFVIITSVGAAAMLTPPAVPHQPVTPVSLVVTIGLLLLTALLVAASFMDRRQRDLLLHLDG
jgi:hypothetical protein